MSIQTNIDNVRAEIMALESATVFDDQAWQRVLADLRAAGRVSALADAERRMETARGNQSVPVAVETVEFDRLMLCSAAAYSHGYVDLADRLDAAAQRLVTT